MVISTQDLCEQKLINLKNGNNAYAESEELIRLLERRIRRENLDVILDRTSSGCWFIPSGKERDAPL